jgi:hypothetical protein
MMSPARRSGWTLLADTNFQHFMVGRGQLLRGQIREAYVKNGSPTWMQGMAAYLGAYTPAEATALFDSMIVKKNGCPICFYDYWAARGDVASLQRAQHILDSALRARGDAVSTLRRPYIAAYGAAYIALAKHDSAAALKMFQALPDTICSICWNSGLAEAQLLEAQHKDREALVILSKIGLGGSLYQNAMLLERARVAERLGERAIAIDGYLYVANAWAPGDSVLQPYVKEARAALKRLNAEGTPGLLVSKPGGAH